uniref:gliding motility lipoprotein GldB n=1 Tax=Robiginitalea sediminis TaxID=1982593 RepID=UPI001E35B255|nr:gliding motility lipoprotein GldB [Robiginitalea sediminis]
MGRIQNTFLAVLAVLWFSGCADSKPEVAAEVREIPLELSVQRFDRDFDKMGPSQLPALKQMYPYLFPEQVPDSIWQAKHRDTLQIEIRAQVDSVFADFGPYQADLELFFKHVKYYFPQAPVPKVVTLTSDVDYQNRVILADSLLLLGLDNYLGPGHRFYGNMDRYIAAELRPDYLTSDVASAFAGKVIPPPRDRSFVAQMVYHGKKLYLKDLMMPLAADSVKIRYSADQMQWAKDNEGQIWRYFVERELLYSTDRELGPRFLDPAPFSKFRLVLDNESPGRLGRYIGWQIVRAYAAQHEGTLQTLLEMPGEELFKASNYKPPK